MGEQVDQLLPIEEARVEAGKEKFLRQMYENLSKPQLTLKEKLGAIYEERVFDTDKPDVKKIKEHYNDPSPIRVRLDDKGRVVESGNLTLEDKFTYDEDGYLTESSHTEVPGQGWDRRFTYVEVTGGKKN